MKKIYSFMVAAVAMFAAVSCNKELPQEEVPTVGETVVYTASTDGSDTKATLNETTRKSEWVAGDAITVHDGSNGWKFTAAEAGANVDFSNSEGFGEYRPVLAVYPAGTYTANVAAKKVKAYIPTWQQAQAGTYHSPAALAVAYSEDNTFAFKNAHALLKFTVNTDNVTHVIFNGNGSEAITGDVYVTLGEEGVESVECLETEFTEKQWNETEQKEEEVKVNKYGTWVECYAYHDEANKYFAKGQTYYIAVAPQKFEGGVTVKVRINDGEELVAKTTTKPVETKINTILNLGEIKYEAPVVHEWAVAGTFNEWSTTANPMELVDGYYVAKNITGLNYTAPTGEETGSSTGIKFVNNGDTWRAGEGQVTAGTWAYVWGDGGNIYVDGATANTAYDIYLNPSEGDYGKFVIVAAGAEMPEDVVVEEEVVVDYWAVIGTMTNNWTSEAEMTLEGDWYVVNEVKILDSDQFKFRANGNWDEGTPNRGAAGEADGVLIENNVETAVYQGGKNFCVSEGGFYSLYINKSATKVKVVKTADLPAVENWGVCGTFTGNWNIASTLAMTALGDGWYTLENVEIYKDDLFKFVIDKAWSNSLGANGAVLTAEDGTEYDLVKDGQNIKVNKNGKFTISLNPTDKKFKVVCVEEYTDLEVNILIDNKANWSPLYIYLEADGVAITPAEGALVSDNVYAVSGDYIGSTLTCKFISGSKVSEVMNVAVTKNGATVTLEETIIKLKIQLDTDNAKQWWGNTMKIHVWSTGTSFDTSWPGNAMTSEGNYTWSIIVPSELVGKTINYLVHNGNGWQSSDATVTINAQGNTVTGSSIGIN